MILTNKRCAFEVLSTKVLKYLTRILKIKYHEKKEMVAWRESFLAYNSFKTLASNLQIYIITPNTKVSRCSSYSIPLRLYSPTGRGSARVFSGSFCLCACVCLCVLFWFLFRSNFKRIFFLHPVESLQTEKRAWKRAFFYCFRPYFDRILTQNPRFSSCSQWTLFKLDCDPNFDNFYKSLTVASTG